jgi:two-component system, OmpR family, response regulator
MLPHLLPQVRQRRLPCEDLGAITPHTLRLTQRASDLVSIATVEILVVEDEEAIADFLFRGLEAEGYEVKVAGDGIAGESLALNGAADLVVLDRMLPGRDGIELLRAIREKKPALPVIMLTAKAEVADRVEGLDLGATDYVTKPFAFEELLARIRSRLREAGDASQTTLEAGGVRLDLLSREASRGELRVRLPEREAGLLAHLLRHAGRVCSREEILAAVWNYDHDPGTNVVQVYVGYLRRKLDLPDDPAPIETVRSVGYRLRER